MTTLYVIKNHDELLHLWQSRGAQGIQLLHIDFHDDLRGLLVDRRRGTAYRAGIFREYAEPLDEGNFLAYAVLDGIVRDIHWIRGRLGGRAYDSSIVMYESDWAAIPHRFAHALRRGREVPLNFRETVYEEWDGITGNVCLDIDWDFFASVELNSKGLSDRLAEFLDRIKLVELPEIYCCYSPRYVHPSREEFQWMIEQLSELYACRPVWPYSYFLSALPGKKPSRMSPTLKKRIVCYFRKQGFF